MNRRVVINLIALGIAAAALFVYLIVDLLAGALFEQSYPVSVQLPESGGLISGQEVTVSGRIVGIVEDVDVDSEGVIAQLNIYADEQIPTNTKVVVQRRSSVGEQAIEFTPDAPPEEYYEEGALIDGGEATLPIEVQRLLAATERTFGAIEPETAGALVGELAAAVRGRRDDLRSIVRESAQFSTTMADGSDEFERLFREGREVTEALADSREALGRSLVHMADSAEILSDMRATFEQLLVDAPPALAQLGGVVGRSQANLACTFGHLGGINAYMAQEEQMEEGERAFRANQFFFQGFKFVTPRSADGRIWTRVYTISEQQPEPERYAQKRPIPETLPGGACSSVFGEGAPAAHQRGFAVVHPEGRIVPASDNRAEPVRVSGPPLGSGRDTTASRGVAASDTPERRGGVNGFLAATGIPLLGLLLAGLLLLAGGQTARRAAARREERRKRE
jgi:virulence factor Mce-like protein